MWLPNVTWWLPICHKGYVGKKFNYIIYRHDLINEIGVGLSAV